MVLGLQLFRQCESTLAHFGRFVKGVSEGVLQCGAWTHLEGGGCVAKRLNTKHYSALQRRRREMGFNLEQVAKVVGKSFSWVHLVELGKCKDPDPACLLDMARLLRYDSVADLKRDIPGYPVTPWGGRVYLRRSGDCEHKMVYIKRPTWTRMAKLCQAFDMDVDTMADEAVKEFLDRLEMKSEGQDTLSSKSSHY